MFQPVQFRPEVETRVRWVEETNPAEIACRDDFTEMHALKHFQAIVDEYYATRAPYRWLHMAAAAKSAAIIHLGKEHRIYEQAKELLAA